MDPLLLQALMTGEDGLGQGADGDINQAIMLALAGGGFGGRGGVGTMGQPYRAPNITTGMDNATAALSAQASQNPFAIGHLMNAQAQSRDAVRISAAMAQHFGDLNRQNALTQRALGGTNTNISTLLKNLHSFPAELQKPILEMAFKGGFQVPEGFVERDVLANQVDIAKKGVDAAASAAPAGINFMEGLNNILQQLDLPAAQASTPHSVQNARIGQTGQNLPKVEHRLNAVTEGPDGVRRAGVVTIKGQSPGQIRTLADEFLQDPRVSTIEEIGAKLSPHELERLRREQQELQQQERGELY